MRILVTGHRGFLGQYISRQLISRGHMVFGISRGEFISDLPPQQQLAADLSDSAAVTRFVYDVQPEVVIHLAAESSVAESWIDPEKIVFTNVMGTLRLIKILLKVKSVRLWVNAGSAEEYRASQHLKRMTENHRLFPANPYGTTKLSQEIMLRQILESAGIEFVQFRMFNITGPGQSNKFVLASFVDQLARILKHMKEPVIVTGDLSKVRDFVDVRDVSLLYCEAVEGRIPSGVYNVCSGVGRRLDNILRQLISLAQVQVKIVEDHSRYRYGDRDFMVGSPGRIQKYMPTFPSIPWEKTLADML